MLEDMDDEEAEVVDGEEVSVSPADHNFWSWGYIHVSFQYLHCIEPFCRRPRFRSLSTLTLSFLCTVYFHERTKNPSHTPS